MNNANRSFLLLVPHHLASGIPLDALGRQSALALDGASDLDDAGVDAAGDAVLHLDVQLRDDVGFECAVFLEVLLG